jgi:hypothetical protein
VQPEGLGKFKKKITSSGIEPVTFWLWQLNTNEKHHFQF